MIIVAMPHQVRAEQLAINLYLKLKPNNSIEQHVMTFNRVLKQQHLLSRYDIKPYLDRHPLHITLYLTEYEKKYIPQLQQDALKLSLEQKSIAIYTQNLRLYSNGYIMLSLARTKSLMRLSQKALTRLSPKRAHALTIPLWAAHDSNRQALFKRYGSPNVLDYFNPHLSILLPPQHVVDSDKRNAELSLALTHFNQLHSTVIESCADALALGIADKEGQIIEELAAWPLKQNNKCM